MAEQWQSNGRAMAEQWQSNGRVVEDVEGWWMRLSKVATGQRLPHKLLLGMIRVTARVSGAPAAPPDIVKMLFYRPEFFGRPYSDLVDTLLRGPSEWSVGERELFGAFTSRLNACPFCAGSHGALASYALGDSVTEAVLADWRTAPIREPLRVTLGLLEKLTLTPEEFGADDVEAARAAGVSEGAVVDALYIGAAFNLINRVANSLGFEIPPTFARGSASRLKQGYKLS
jgi:uncharacterized peroxidase-related enzyme